MVLLALTNTRLCPHSTVIERHEKKQAEADSNINRRTPNAPADSTSNQFQTPDGTFLPMSAIPVFPSGGAGIMPPGSSALKDLFGWGCGWE